MAGGSKKGGTQKVDNSPWKPIQQYIVGDNDTTGYLQKAYEEILMNPTRYYEGETVVDFNDLQKLAMQQTAQRASSDTDELSDAGAAEMLATAQGKYVGKDNPYLGQVANKVGDSVQQQLGSRYGAAGRMAGNPAETQMFARELSNALAGYQYQTYGQERALQQQASNALQGIEEARDDADYADIDRLYRVGGLQRGYEQARTDAAKRKWDYEQQEAAQRIKDFASILGLNNTGSSQKSESSQNTSAAGAAGSALGGAATGAAVGSMFGPWGTAAGGLLGGGSGYLGSK